MSLITLDEWKRRGKGAKIVTDVVDFKKVPGVAPYALFDATATGGGYDGFAYSYLRKTGKATVTGRDWNGASTESAVATERINAVCKIFSGAWGYDPLAALSPAQMANTDITESEDRVTGFMDALNYYTINGLTGYFEGVKDIVEKTSLGHVVESSAVLNDPTATTYKDNLRQLITEINTALQKVKGNAIIAVNEDLYTILINARTYSDMILYNVAEDIEDLRISGKKVVKLGKYGTNECIETNATSGKTDLYIIAFGPKDCYYATPAVGDLFTLSNYKSGANICKQLDFLFALVCKSYDSVAKVEGIQIKDETKGN